MVDLLPTPPGFLGDNRVSPVYVDGVEVGAFAAAIEANGYKAGQRLDSGSRFWSTPPRLPDAAPLRDVFEVDLSGARLINVISFDLAHFPQDCLVEWSPDSTAPFQPVLSQSQTPLTLSISDSNPPVVQGIGTQSMGHPQHFGAGHWDSHKFKVVPITAARLRLVLTRPLGRNYPTDSLGTSVSYSLGVRSFQVGYEVLTRDDIPFTEFRPGSVTEHLPFAATRDLLGSSVLYAERENRARILLQGGVWRSEPQPVANAVVPLYIDVSNNDGSPTVVERLFLEPLVSGVSLNLYATPEPLADGQTFDDVEWVPINRDFILRRGYIRFDPIEATFLKMEFTNLAPEPYDAPEAMVREVLLFPASLDPQNFGITSGNSGGIGTLVQSQLATLLRYEDNDLLATQGLTDLSVGYTPTEVFYSSDPSAAERLRNLSAFYNYKPWQGGYSAPSWPSTQKHVYVHTEVLHDQRVAFYVGLRTIQVFRLDYTFTEDTNAYLEYFYDDLHLEEVKGWTLTTGDLLSGQGFSEATSKALTSRTGVRGIQFATTQSPPVQLLGDDDFDSATIDLPSVLMNWGTVGEGEAPATLSISNRYNTDIGTTVTITRDGSVESDPAVVIPHTWASIGIRYKTYSGIRNAGLSYGDLNSPLTSSGVQSLGGIFNRTIITPSLGGRLYAAARVISDKALTEPLFIQIVDTSVMPEKVVAEAPAMIPANQVVEWEVPYETAGTVQTWDGLAGKDYQTLSSMTWGQVATQEQIAPIRAMVRLVQKGSPNASWSVDTLSLFEDAILWEFSNNDGMDWYPAPSVRNNPNGVMLFPEPPLADAHTYEAIEGMHDDQPTKYEDLIGSWDDLVQAIRTVPPTRNLVRWRVSCGLPNQHVNALSIRPWYDYTGNGIPSIEGVNVPGANLALYDQYQPIKQDPRWRQWNKPVPLAWFFFYRQFVLTRHDGVTVLPPMQNTFLADGLVDPIGSGRLSISSLEDGFVLPFRGPSPSSGTITGATP